MVESLGLSQGLFRNFFQTWCHALCALWAQKNRNTCAGRFAETFAPEKN